MKYLLHLLGSDSRKTKVTLMLSLLTCFCTAMLLARVVYTNDFYYGFLLWNLFLAWIPFIFAWFTYKNYFLSGNKVWIAITAFTWLIFFPNAPYIITDLIHIQTRTGIPVWFDAVLVFCFAFDGFVLGLASLYMIHRILEDKFQSVVSWLMILTIIILSGYGIYMGRILRWNSWDVFTHTLPMLHEVHDTFFTTSSVAMIMVFSIFIGITYPFLFYFVRSVQKK